MNRRRDLDAVLRQLDPARAEIIPEPDSLQARRIRRKALRAGRRSHHGGRRALVAVAAALVVLSGGVAAGVYWFTDTPSAPSTVLCFDEPDLDGDRIVAAVQGDQPDVSDCAPEWKDGPFASSDPIPDLVGCVIPDGALAVFPGDEAVCETLGLAVSTGEVSLSPLRSLDTAVLELVEGRCVPFRQGEGQVRALFEEAAVDGWSVRVETAPSAERPCLSHSLDTTSQELVLTPIPDLFGS